MSSARFLAPGLAALFSLASAAQAGEAAGRPAREDSYILARGNQYSMSGSLNELRAARRLCSGDFLLARRGGRDVLIRDPKTLDEAASAFAPLSETEPLSRELERSQRDLQARQESLDREQERVERELDRIADDEEEGVEAAGSDETRRELESRQRDLETKARALEGEERELDAREREIDRRNDELERQAEATLWRFVDRAIAEGRFEKAPAP